MEKITSFFTALVLIITYLTGFGAVTVSDGYELTGKKKLDPFVSMFTAQGLCCDGEHFYGSGAMTGAGFTGLSKFSLDFRPLKLKSAAVPKEFKKKYGSNHIGGIDCANGLIYAPVEGKGYAHNFILLYDCETLDYTGVYYDLTGEKLGDGIPWCAVDAENGRLYTSPFNGVTEILEYDLESMEYLGSIVLDREINRIQGGKVYDGRLYLSHDAKSSTDEMLLSVDIATGRVDVELTRHMPNYDNEAEDVCVYPMPDGSLFHFMDYDKLICATVWHFKKAD